MSDDVSDQTASAEETATAPVVEKPVEPDYFSQLLRLKAEFENYRKRVDREKPDWYRLGAAGVLSKLLPLYDLLRHAHEEVKAGHAETPLAKGMEAIFREYDKLFKEEGVTKMDPLGKPFDPAGIRRGGGGRRAPGRLPPRRQSAAHREGAPAEEI